MTASKPVEMLYSATEACGFVRVPAAQKDGALFLRQQPFDLGKALCLPLCGHPLAREFLQGSRLAAGGKDQPFPDV